MLNHQSLGKYKHPQALMLLSPQHQPGLHRGSTSDGDSSTSFLLHTVHMQSTDLALVTSGCAPQVDCEGDSQKKWLNNAKDVSGGL